MAGREQAFVDLTGLMVALQARSKAETRVNDLKKKDPKERARCLAPEDCFTKVEMEAIKPIWDWVGPDGALESDMRIANPVRWQRSILPKATYGALIASLNDTDADVSQPGLVDRLSANAFLVKSTYSQKATGNRNGFLYFAVNDVVGPKGSRAKDVDFPDLFFVDNIGAFYVKVSVSPK